MGCFKDNVNQPDLNAFKWTNNQILTVEICVDACNNRMFLFAGLQSG